jgi:hypothetical protein
MPCRKHGKTLQTASLDNQIRTKTADISHPIRLAGVSPQWTPGQKPIKIRGESPHWTPGLGNRRIKLHGESPHHTPIRSNVRRLRLGGM